MVCCACLKAGFPVQAFCTTLQPTCAWMQVADAGTLSGTGEATFLLDLLHDNFTAPSDAIPCQSMSTGSILGHSVVVVTTGVLSPSRGVLCQQLPAWGSAVMRLSWSRPDMLLWGLCKAGIGPETAALCVVYILECASSNVKEIIYQGTAGWTPQVGCSLCPNFPGSCMQAWERGMRRCLHHRWEAP